MPTGAAELEGVLRKPPEQRSEEDLTLALDFFEHTAFFKQFRSEQAKAKEICRHIGLLRFQENGTVFVQNEVGDTFYTIIEGTVRVLVGGRAVTELHAGECFGEISVLGRTEDEQRRTATILADCDDTVLASLGRGPYVKIVGGFAEAVLAILRKPRSQRTFSDVNLLATEFVKGEFFRQLYYTVFQRRCCERFVLTELHAGKKLEAAKKGQKFFNIVVSGVLSARDEKGKEVHRFQPGDSFFGGDLFGGARALVVTAVDETNVVTITKNDYDEVRARVFAVIHSPW
jgi:CRP-like cAMP-binding protein